MASSREESRCGRKCGTLVQVAAQPPCSAREAGETASWVIYVAESNTGSGGKEAVNLSGVTGAMADFSAGDVLKTSSLGMLSVVIFCLAGFLIAHYPGPDKDGGERGVLTQQGTRKLSQMVSGAR